MHHFPEIDPELDIADQVGDHRAFALELRRKVTAVRTGAADASTLTELDWMAINLTVGQMAHRYEYAIETEASRALEQLRLPTPNLRALIHAQSNWQRTLKESPSSAETADAQVATAVAAYLHDPEPAPFANIKTLADLDAAVEERLAQEGGAA